MQSDVEEALLAPAELTPDKVSALLGRLASRRLDRGEIYFQSLVHESWSLEDGQVKDGSFSVERGAGVRAVDGERSGLAYVDDIEFASLQDAVDTARGITRHQGEGRVAVPSPREINRYYGGHNPIEIADEDAKIDLLMRVDKFVRELDCAVVEVSVRLALSRSMNLVAATDGTWGFDVRPLARLDVSVIVERDGRRERGFGGGGDRVEPAWLTESDRPFEFGREAVRVALLALEAEEMPVGAMPVVLGPGWPGILLHEAVGHGLEGDFNRHGTSAFSNRLGEPVASSLCTVIDDATRPGARGSLSLDDEGTPGEATVLIEKGVLKGYLHDRQNAALMGHRPTGNARRQSYAHPPLPRMTNTYLANGHSDPGEIVSSVDRGIYCVSFGGGQVDITTGKFVFSVTEAYRIERGKIGAPVRGATLIGNGPEVMQRVSMVGNDLAFDGGVGVCGKDGQSVAVGVGQPTLKVDEIMIGGTANPN